MLVTALRAVIALTDIAISKYDAIRERRARARAADRAVDTRRAHLFGFWLAERGEHCAYCNVDKLPENEFLLCPATGEAPR